MTSIQVSLVYASPTGVWSHAMTLACDATVGQAIRESGCIEALGLADAAKLSLGIFGKVTTLSQRLKGGDRIEIYRTLIFDPKQSRRRRAIHRQKLRNKKKKVPINDVTI